MALVDPQSVKISGVTTSLPRVSTGDFKSTYESADGNTILKLSTTSSNRKRQVLRLDISKITSDPFIPAQNVEVSMSTYIVIDRPPAGFTNAEALANVLGMMEILTKEESKVAVKLLASES